MMRKLEKLSIGVGISYLSLWLLLSMPALASVTDDANAGLDALARGNLAEAVQMLSKALGSGLLRGPDIELAFVKRGQAYIGLGRLFDAQRDLEAALKLDPTDQEAVTLLRQAQTPATITANHGVPRKLGEVGAWAAAVVEQTGSLSCYAFTASGSSVLTVTRRAGDLHVAVTGIGNETTTLLMYAGTIGENFYGVGGVAFASDSERLVRALRTARQAVLDIGTARRLSFSLDGFPSALAMAERACSGSG